MLNFELKDCFMVVYVWILTIFFSAFYAHEFATEKASRETRRSIGYKLENCNKIIMGSTK